MEKEKIYKGLSKEEVILRQDKFGKNELVPEKKDNIFKTILRTLCEPMFLLLIIAAVIYFILGEPRDGAIMLISVVGIISIDIIQGQKTDKTLNALKDLSAPHINVIRDGAEETIPSSDLVPGDIMLIYEGIKIPADGEVLKCADLCVDESSLTGESEGVWKNPADGCFAGTLVTQGTATIKVTGTGPRTEYGKIGLDVALAPSEDTPLQKQTRKLVLTCACIAGGLFILVCILTWFNTSALAVGDRLIQSIIAGVTLAMALIPEEFPVVLTVFLSMGAWRLAKKHSLVRRLPSVETLGAVSVLCVDKTGTITMNKMSVENTWVYNSDENTLLETMGLGCETDAYDPMEKAMLEHCENHGIKKEDLFANIFVYEYAFTNELKMMGHVWEKDGQLITAAKGSPERIFTLCNLTGEELTKVQTKADEMAAQGLRVIAVAMATPKNMEEVPKELTSCKLTLLGLIGLADPPRDGVKEDIAKCTKAGVRVVMITGDNGSTASAIANKVGITGSDKIITGDELKKMSDEKLKEAVKTVSIFSRVVPEHKMRIINAFKDNREIVAMTGDGVNDAPALKYADIGIAMGKRGSEVSREAADLILMDDNFTTIVETIRDGRRIYDNIRKTVGYIFTIHIPVALAALFGPLLGITPAALLLLPLHVVLFELVIDPTCSIVLERQPAERDIMDRPPRDSKKKLLTSRLLSKSLIQGFFIFIASFGSYFITLDGDPSNAPLARSMGFTVIMLANLFLVQVNSSDHDFAIQSAARLSKDKIMWIVNLGTLALLGVILYTPLASFLKLAPLSVLQFLCIFGISAVSVLWYEVVKGVKRVSKSKNPNNS